MNSIGSFSISDLPAVKFDGIYRVLGCIPSSPETVAEFPIFGVGGMFGALDPSLWKDIDLQWYNNPIWDQKATSSCVGQGVTSGMQMCYMQSGRPLVEFNPYFPYGLINGGRDAGAMISSGLTALKTYGVCQKAELPPGVMFRNQFPPSAFENAKRFKLVMAYRCPTFEDCCAAITTGFVVPLGIMVGSNFSSLDSNGVAPLPAGGGGGHCMLGMGLKKSARYGWMIKLQNSWGKRFGMNGFCYIHKGHFQSMPPDAFAIQSVMDDPLDNTPNDDIPVATN